MLPAAFIPEGLAAVGRHCPVYILFSLIANIFYDSFAFDSAPVYALLLSGIYVLALTVNLSREVREG